MSTENEQLISLPQSYQYTFTVFTPTYNRAHTLHRVYESLKAQTYRQFEWLIIDDGSTDNTSKLVEQWQIENQFPIRYIYQENAGKHIAFNHGVREAQGELFLNFDSDDGCVPQALERLKYHWDAISEEQKKQFSGVTCLCKDHHGKIVGSFFPSDYIDSDALEIRYRFKVLGEKWGFHTTDILREFPFLEDIRQTYIPENLVWNKIAQKYKTRFVNEALRIYWTEGSSLTRGRSPRNGMIGNRLANLAVLNDDIDWLRFAPLKFLHASANYIRFSFHLRKNIFQQFRSLNSFIGKLLWLIALPLGFILYSKDWLLIFFSQINSTA